MSEITRMTLNCGMNSTLNKYLMYRRKHNSDIKRFGKDVLFEGQPFVQMNIYISKYNSICVSLVNWTWSLLLSSQEIQVQKVKLSRVTHNYEY